MLGREGEGGPKISWNVCRRNSRGNRCFGLGDGAGGNRLIAFPRLRTLCRQGICTDVLAAVINGEGQLLLITAVAI
jgi:hypothetical protein